MKQIQGYTATTAWRALLTAIVRNGDPVKPRDIGTRELIGYTTRIDMNLPVVNVPERKLNYRFMAGEAWWILTGHDDVESISQFNPVIARFSDDGKTFAGAYGPKIRQQLAYIVDTLQKDLSSRQAVLTIWERNPGPSKDIPCTVAIQFLVREGTIYTNVFMRSSDAWLGWVYDVFNFSMLTRYVQLMFQERTFHRLALGALTLTAGSQHLYDTDYERALSIVDSPGHALTSAHLSQSNQRFDEFVQPHQLTDWLVNMAHMEKSASALKGLVYDAPQQG